ncbi:hypothetical protein, partial [Escherichia coli]|uniref:hypothetical protein n=1 Tax=Escherichia coli TaxID=562 RepID=UPI001BAF8591
KKKKNKTRKSIENLTWQRQLELTREHISVGLRSSAERACRPVIFRTKEHISAYPLCPAKTSRQPEHRD